MNKEEIKEKSKKYALRGWRLYQTLRGTGGFKTAVIWFLVGFILAAILSLLW